MADESLLVNIPINDDGLDETDEEIFIVHLVLHDAVNRDLITIEQATSNCLIFDSGHRGNTLYCMTSALNVTLAKPCQAIVWMSKNFALPCLANAL